MNKATWIVSPAPFLLTRPTLSRMSAVTVLTLVPQLCLMAIEGDYAAILSIFVAVAGCVLGEVCMTIPYKKPFPGDRTVFVVGLITGFLLPSTLGPAAVLLVSFSGYFIARAVFGGTGSYWMSPAAVTAAIAYISQPGLFPDQLLTPESVRTIGDSFRALKLDSFRGIDVDQSLTAFLNQHIFAPFDIKLPEGYITLFWHSPSTIPAFRYNALTLASSILLISMSVIDWIIPLCFLCSYAICVWFVSTLPFALAIPQGDILFAFLTGGILFITFYVLPEYNTNPRTRGGKAASGILAGLTAFAVCGPGGSPVGAVFTVIIINAINPLIEYIENRTIASAGDFA